MKAFGEGLLILAGRGRRALRRWTAWAHPRRHPLRLLSLMLLLQIPKLWWVVDVPNPDLFQKPHFSYVYGWLDLDDHGIFLLLEQDHRLSTVASWFHGDWVHRNGFYRPLSAVSLWLDYLLWRQRHRGYALTSWMLQCLTAWLLALLVDRMLGHALCALLAGGAFSWVWLPSNRMIVQHLSTRIDSLCLVWMLTALLWGLRWVDTGQGRWMAASLGAGLLALWSKEMALTLPLLLPVVHGLRGKPQGWRRALLMSMALGLLVAAWGMAYHLFLPQAMAGRWAMMKPQRLLWQYRLALLGLLPSLAWFLFWLLGKPSLWNFLMAWAWVMTAQFLLTLVGVGLVVRFVPRAALFFLLWALITWIPLLPVRLHNPHYEYIPSMATYTLLGAMAFAFLEAVGRLRRDPGKGGRLACSSAFGA